MNSIRYFNITWASRYDGPGNRVVVFLQGCNLSCSWCHSPHSQAASSPLLFFPNLCTQCERCAAVCKQGVHHFANGIHSVVHALCLKCGSCIDACPVSSGHKAGALYLPTREVEVTQLFRELEPQLKLLQNNGGITFSGGEPLLQSKALAELARLCKANGYHVAVETSGVVDTLSVEPLLPYVDCWLVGFRLLQGHSKGVVPAMEVMVRRFLETVRHAGGSSIIARIPIIPNITDNKEYLDQVRLLTQEFYIDKVELLPHNPESDHYYRALGVPPLAIYNKEQSETAFQNANRIFT